MEQISQTYISLLQMNGLFYIGNIILLWMVFRGVTNANLHGANTFGKVMHSIISLCVVAFNANIYGNMSSALNNWAYAASQSGEVLPEENLKKIIKTLMNFLPCMLKGS